MRNLSVIKGMYQGNGVTRRFAIPFEYNDTAQIFVTVTTYDDGDYTYRVLDNTEFTIDEDSVEIVYPKSADDTPISNSQYLTVWRDTDLLQLIDLTNQGAAWPDSIEGSFDKLHQIVQELAEGLSRALKVDIGDPQTPDQKLIAIQDYVLAAAESSRSASASEASAQRAAEAAATSEANAAESERLAGGYADTASDAASRAEDSAISARAYNAPDYDNAKTYQAGEVVTYTDGNSYRALQETTGHEPPNIIYWQKVTDYVGDNFFEVDEYGYIVPMDSPSHSRYWRIDQNGYIVPIEGGDGGYRPDTRSLSAEYLNVTNEGYVKHLRADDVNAGNLSATGNVTAGMVTTPQANMTMLTANAVNAQSASVGKLTAGNAPVYSIGDFDGETNEDRLHNALSTITEGTLYCGKINVTKSFDVASTNTDYRRVTLVGANITVNEVPMFVSSKPDSQYAIDNSVPSFANCFIKGNNDTKLLGDFNAITTKFDSCKIISCPIYTSDTRYIQSLFINNTDILSMDADFAKAFVFYNLNIANSRIERGDGRLFVVNTTNSFGIINGAITNTLIEGRTAPAIYSKGGFFPLVIENCYFEGNSYPLINVDNNNVAGALYIRGCYFNIDEMTENDKLIKLNGSDVNWAFLIEENTFYKANAPANTIVLTDFAKSQAQAALKRMLNFFTQSNIIMSSNNLNMLAKAFSPTKVGSNLVVRVPLNAFTNLWLTNLTLDIDFYGTKQNAASVVFRDYIYLKIALISNDTADNTPVIKPIIANEFKTSNDVSVTATVENNAYNAKNGVLVLTFSGFDTTNYSFDMCKVHNNNIGSLWEE